MLRGVRGATTVERNDSEQILSRTAELLTELITANNIKTEDIGAVIFASTPDLPAAFPAAAARRIGWDTVPLFGTQEIDNPDGVPLCIRILILWNSDLPQQDIVHAYLHGADRLRPDLDRQRRTAVTLPDRQRVASFDVDPQNTFTPVCPDELPVPDGDAIVAELNAQAAFAARRIASRDAHCLQAVWIATGEQPQFSPVSGQPDADIHWKPHAIVGTKGFEFLAGLNPQAYDFQVYKGVDPAMHPYGACYHDLAATKSTGVIEVLRQWKIDTVIVGGLATDYCVKTTVLQLRRAGFRVIVNLGACRGIHPDTVEAAIAEMRQAGAQFITNAAELS